MEVQYGAGIGSEREHDFCVTCYVKMMTLTAADVILIIGNIETQHIVSFAYCAEHVMVIIEAFGHRELVLSFEGEPNERASEVLVKWGYDSAYFL
jgi:hypothetical protein